MLGLLAFMLTLGLQDPVNGPNGAAGAFYSYVDGMKYTFVVSRQDAADSPRWDDPEENPPLAPRAAIRSAKALMSSLRSDGSAWQVQAVHLNPILLPGVWIYLVEFHDAPPAAPGAGIVGGPAKSMRIVVLMNGSAVIPTVERQ